MVYNEAMPKLKTKEQLDKAIADTAMRIWSEGEHGEHGYLSALIWARGYDSYAIWREKRGKFLAKRGDIALPRNEA